MRLAPPTRARLSAFALAAAFLLPTGCHRLPGHPSAEPEVPRPEQVLDFPTLYKKNCAACHGENAKNGASLPLANPVYIAIAGQDNIIQITAKGVPGKLMPPFAKSAGGMLTDQQVDIIAQGIVKTWGTPNLLATQNPPPYTATLTGDPARGQQAFTTSCAHCHGPSGQGVSGDQKGAGKLGSIVDSTYLTLVSDQYLRSIILGGMPDRGMPDWRSDASQPLTDQQTTDLVAWLSSQRTLNQASPIPRTPEFAVTSSRASMQEQQPMTPNDQTQPPDEALVGKSTTDEAMTNVPEHPPRPGHSRRVFLFKISLLLNGAVGAVLAVPILGYLLGPAMKKGSANNSWVNLGPVANFPEGETRLVNYRNPETTEWDGQTGDIPCWVRRVSGNTFQVFAINCAHLGCPVRWFAQSKLFLCPCHGGAYYADGARASGPPERGLFEYTHKIVAGALVISAGQMPTLSNHAAAEPPLIQLEGAAATRLASLDQFKPKPTPRCASCQS